MGEGSLMIRIFRYGAWISLALSAALWTSGCHNNQDATAASSNQAALNQSADPADANLAPVPANSEVAQDQSGAASSAPSYAPVDNSDYSEQPVETAPQPPPPLPDYEQPPCPGNNYIWTPGYWAYSPSGYYWVPGAWVEPPYTGALWTPGYWGYTDGAYQFYPGHWGNHIGYYGGINYGFGYVGLGYQGGYWNHGVFEYNRSANNVNDRDVRNVYDRPVPESSDRNRVSFNGGSRGVQARPRPEEMQAWREPNSPRMNTQVQQAESFRSDRQQFESVNHGRPASPTVNKPIQADRNVRPMPPQPRGEQPVRQYRSGPGRNEVRGGPAPRTTNGRPDARPQSEQKPRPGHPELHPQGTPN
jgi:WXXGXW repeat (2 copies)